jgi:hypothetical protein
MITASIEKVTTTPLRNANYKLDQKTNNTVTDFYNKAGIDHNIYGNAKIQRFTSKTPNEIKQQYLNSTAMRSSLHKNDVEKLNLRNQPVDSKNLTHSGMHKTSNMMVNDLYKTHLLQQIN